MFIKLRKETGEAFAVKEILPIYPIFTYFRLYFKWVNAEEYCSPLTRHF